MSQEFLVDLKVHIDVSRFINNEDDTPANIVSTLQSHFSNNIGHFLDEELGDATSVSVRVWSPDYPCGAVWVKLVSDLWTEYDS